MPVPAKDYLLDPNEGHIIPPEKWPENRKEPAHNSARTYRSIALPLCAGLAVGMVVGAAGIMILDITNPEMMDPLWTWVIQLLH